MQICSITAIKKDLFKVYALDFFSEFIEDDKTLSINQMQDVWNITYMDIVYESDFNKSLFFLVEKIV